VTVFVDTSAILAFIDRNERNHTQAVDLWGRLRHEGEMLVCSSYVLLESFALIQNRLGMDAVRDLQENLTPLFQVVWVDNSLHQAGIVVLLAANHRQLSLVDCVSFELCRRRGVDIVFAFDQHFVEQGFICLT
jgi:predicted nucleic acid-binding protein